MARNFSDDGFPKKATCGPFLVVLGANRTRDLGFISPWLSGQLLTAWPALQRLLQTQGVPLRLWWSNYRDKTLYVMLCGCRSASGGPFMMLRSPFGTCAHNALRFIGSDEITLPLGAVGKCDQWKVSLLVNPGPCWATWGKADRWGIALVCHLFSVLFLTLDIRAVRLYHIQLCESVSSLTASLTPYKCSLVNQNLFCNLTFYDWPLIGYNFLVTRSLLVIIDLPSLTLRVAFQESKAVSSRATNILTSISSK